MHIGDKSKLALRITANHADAEEVTCDVYQQIWRTAALFDPTRGVLFQWIMSIARSRALDHCRRNRSVRARLRIDPAEPPDPELDPGLDAALEQLEALEQVTTLLSRLPPLQLRLIHLAFFEDLTHRAIAARTQLPLGTIKSSIRRALQLLRSALPNAAMISRRSHLCRAIGTLGTEQNLQCEVSKRIQR